MCFYTHLIIINFNCMSELFVNFIELCKTCGISEDYFKSSCYEYLDLVSEFESFDSVYKDIYEDVKWTLGHDGNVYKKDIRDIEQNAIKKLVHPKICDYFQYQFNFDTDVLIKFAETQILNLDHDYDFENINNLQLRHENWKLCFVVLNLFRNLKITKYTKWLDRLIKSKTELLENVDYVIENKEELEMVKQFYRTQLIIIQ